MSTKSGRLASLDMLKGFAIFMVIAGHAVQYLISGDYYDKAVYRVIYSFHMPLFMAITGFLIGGVNTRASVSY